MKKFRTGELFRNSFRYFLFVLFFNCANGYAYGQTIFVDSRKGNDGASGTAVEPLKSLSEAVIRTNSYIGGQPVDIKLNPGVYLLERLLKIKTGATDDKAFYTIEAAMMPDDSNWTPQMTPVIESVSGINDTAGFPHCEGMLILKSHVALKGLKFIGNPNTGVETYYPIRRADSLLSDLQVSQCFFIGEKNSTAIQSALWVAGAGIHIDHCIFQSCKIVTVLGFGVNDFCLTHSIINDAYNTAIWYGFARNVRLFTFRDNIVLNCYYVMVYPAANGQPDFTLASSYLINNKNYVGSYPIAQDRFVSEPITRIKERNIKNSGNVKLVGVGDDGITHDNLNLTGESDGRETSAGIFIK